MPRHNIPPQVITRQSLEPDAALFSALAWPGWPGLAWPQPWPGLAWPGLAQPWPGPVRIVAW
jgi:hypothetical protein